MVDWLIKTCMETSDDIYYGVCPREVMEARYPGSKRTYTNLKDMEVCGADMNVVHVRMASEHLDVWNSLIANRRESRRAGPRVMGLDTLYLLLTRQATLQDFVERVSRASWHQGPRDLSGLMLNLAWMWISPINWK